MPDQADRLRAELAKKKSRIAELQHEVDTTDSHRRQVQAHNHELEEQLAQALHMLQVNCAAFSIILRCHSSALSSVNTGIQNINLNQPVPIIAPTCLSWDFDMHNSSQMHASSNTDSGRLVQRLAQADSD